MVATNPQTLGLLAGYLNSQAYDKRVHVVERLGWFDKDKDLSFVLPDRVIGKAKDIYYTGDQLAYTVVGSLEDWQRRISRYCRGNSRLIFSVSVPFAAPLLYLLGEPSGGYNLVGDTQTRKSTATDAG